MKKRRYSEAQVVRILRQVDGGKPVVIAARHYGVSRARIHRWKTRYGGIILTELKRLKASRRKIPGSNISCTSKR